MSDGFSPSRIRLRWKRPACYDRMLAFRIVTAFFGRSAWSGSVRLIASTSSIPATTRPNAGCFGSSRAFSTTLMKNGLPPLFGPAFVEELDLHVAHRRLKEDVRHAAAIRAPYVKPAHRMPASDGPNRYPAGSVAARGR